VGNSVLAVQMLVGTILCMAAGLMAIKGWVYDNFVPTSELLAVGRLPDVLPGVGLDRGALSWAVRGVPCCMSHALVRATLSAPAFWTTLVA
jgi:hypothetical protein